MSKPTFMIVGASLTGAKAAEELRERGFDGRVVLLESEAERPCERPPLTKDYLRGESAREKAYAHAEGFYAERQIELETGTTVVTIDSRASRVTLDNGRELHFDRLLLATGAEPRRLPVPGADLGGIHYLRTLANEHVQALIRARQPADVGALSDPRRRSCRWSASSRPEGERG